MLFSHDSQLKLKEFFLVLAKAEIRIEKERQILAAMPEFEPFSAFQRINKTRDGLLSALQILNFLRDNGYSGVEKEDIRYLIHFFD